MRARPPCLAWYRAHRQILPQTQATRCHRAAPSGCGATEVRSRIQETAFLGDTGSSTAPLSATAWNLQMLQVSVRRRTDTSAPNV